MGTHSDYPHNAAHEQNQKYSAHFKHLNLREKMLEKRYINNIL